MLDFSERRLTTLLKPFFKIAMPPSINDGNFTVVHELRTLQGRPDLVLFQNQFSWDETSTIQQAGTVMASYTSAAVLGAFHQKKRIVLDSLSDSLSISDRSIRKSIINLADTGLLEIKGKFLIKTAFLKRLSVPLTAIEVKQRLSKKAIFQARQYRSFAARGIITIWYDQLAKKHSPASSLAPIGLIGIDYNGKAKYIHPARKQSPRNPMAYYYALGNAYAGNSVRPSGFAASLPGPHYPSA